MLYHNGMNIPCKSVREMKTVLPLTSQYNTDMNMTAGHQKLNASLALQLCRRWMIEKDQWTDASTSTRPTQGVSRFSDGLPTPFKEGTIF